MPAEGKLTKRDESCTDATPRDYYTLPEMMDLFQVSRSTLDRMEQNGEDLGRFKFGGQVRYVRAKVHAYVEAQTRKTG